MSRIRRSIRHRESGNLLRPMQGSKRVRPSVPRLPKVNVQGLGAALKRARKQPKNSFSRNLVSGLLRSGKHVDREGAFTARSISKLREQ